MVLLCWLEQKFISVQFLTMKTRFPLLISLVACTFSEIITAYAQSTCESYARITFPRLAGNPCSADSDRVFAKLSTSLTPPSQPKQLSLRDRVAYQRAIEEVYWQHRIWPKERPDSKPSLDEVMPAAQLSQKVGDYLLNSQALEDYWHQPVTAEQLQAEMERMAQHTKQPNVLRELFAALGNDPFVIAECLARPTLSERLVTDRLQLAVPEWRKKAIGSWSARAENQMPKVIAARAANYALPTISQTGNGFIEGTGVATSITDVPISALGCTNDSWTATSTTNALPGRFLHTAVWTGSEMIVWGGYDGISSLNTGGRYTPSTDSSTVISATNAPTGRFQHTAVWTGGEMIVWGGEDSSGTYLNTGGRYDPGTDSWTATSTTNVPTRRFLHTAAWTTAK